MYFALTVLATLLTSVPAGSCCARLTYCNWDKCVKQKCELETNDGVSTPNTFARKSEDVLLPCCKTGAKSEGCNQPGPLVGDSILHQIATSWSVKEVDAGL
jgi:hypothetical protein